MSRKAPPRAGRVFIRSWLARLLNVNAQTLSTWISQGELRSYDAREVKRFLLKHPQVLARAVARAPARPARRR